MAQFGLANRGPGAPAVDSVGDSEQANARPRTATSAVTALDDAVKAAIDLR
jgi:hypothetical protein